MRNVCVYMKINNQAFLQLSSFCVSHIIKVGSLVVDGDSVEMWK